MLRRYFAPWTRCAAALGEIYGSALHENSRRARCYERATALRSRQLSSVIGSAVGLPARAWQHPTETDGQETDIQKSSEA